MLFMNSRTLITLFRSSQSTILLLTRLLGVPKLVSLVGTRTKARIRTGPQARMLLTPPRTRRRQPTMALLISRLQGTQTATASARKASASIARNQDTVLLSVRRGSRMLSIDSTLSGQWSQEQSRLCRKTTSPRGSLLPREVWCRLM